MRRRGGVGAAVRTVLYTARAAEQYGAYLGPLLSVCPDCREIAAPLAGRLSDTQTPQGIFVSAGGLTTAFLWVK